MIEAQEYLKKYEMHQKQSNIPWKTKGTITHGNRQKDGKMVQKVVHKNPGESTARECFNFFIF